MRDKDNVPEWISGEQHTRWLEQTGIACQRIMRAIELTKPIRVFGLVSGGHDSMTAAWVLSRCGVPFDVVHVNTGFGIEATREYVRTQCHKLGWNLIEKKAMECRRADGTLDPQDYEAMVRRFGFPGPGWHGRMYQRLKERCLRMLERESGASCKGKNKRRVLYVNGCRSQESARRMANTQEMQVHGRTVWCAPIHDWSKGDTSVALALAGIERNPVVDLIHMSGECLCGAMADKNREQELAQLAAYDLTRPAYERIMRLQNEVKPCKGWGWGERPPKAQVCKEKPGQLCWSCMK